MVGKGGLSGAEVLAWAAGRVCGDRGREVSPEERTLRELLDRLEREPAAYPSVADWKLKKPPEVLGIYEPAEARLYVTEGQIKALCTDMKVTPRSWLGWLKAQGLAEAPVSATRLGGDDRLKARWWKVDTGAAGDRPEGGGGDAH